MFSLGFLTEYRMDICFSSITFQYLLFVSFPNISYPFRSIHQIWTDLNLLRMSGSRCIMLFCLLFSSLILTLLAATLIIGHVCSDSCRYIADPCAMCNAYVVFMVWVHGIRNYQLETRGTGLAHSWWWCLLKSVFWDNRWYTEKLKRYYRELYTPHPIFQLLTSSISVVHLSKLRNQQWY